MPDVDLQRAQRDRADRSGLAVLDEVDVEILQHAEHDQLLDGAGLDDHLHEHVTGDQHGEERREHADEQREAEALDRTGAEPDHDTADDELHQVGVENRGERLFEAALVGGHERLADG